MKKILITITIAILTTFSVNAQKLEKIDVYSPFKTKKLGTVKTEKELMPLIQKIYEKNGTVKFNVVRYFDNGKVVQCRIQKKQQQII